MRLMLALIIAAVIALPITAQAGNNKAAHGHKVKTASGKIKAEPAVVKPKDATPVDSYSQTR